MNSFIYKNEFGPNILNLDNIRCLYIAEANRDIWDKIGTRFEVRALYGKYLARVSRFSTKGECIHLLQNNLKCKGFIEVDRIQEKALTVPGKPLLILVNSKFIARAEAPKPEHPTTVEINSPEEWYEKDFTSQEAAHNFLELLSTGASTIWYATNFI